MPTQAEIAQALRDNPLLWARTFLCIPGTDGEPFEPTHVERVILGAPSKRLAIRVPRRRGKTFGCVARILHRLFNNRGFEVIVTAPQEAHIDGPMELIKAFIKESPLLSDTVIETKGDPFPTILFPESHNKVSGITAGQTTRSPGLKLRSQKAHMVLVDEAAYMLDAVWRAVDPIIEGNQFFQNVEALIASTVDASRTRYYDYCTDPTQGYHPIHIPYPDIQDPDITPEKIAALQRSVPSFTWRTEYLCEFPNQAENVFSHTSVDTAKAPYGYSLEPAPNGSKVAMGIDWDKFQAGVTIVVAAITPGFHQIRVLYREEVSRGEYTYLAAVKRIKELAKIFKPQHVAADRGAGESNIEELKFYGSENPDSGLHGNVTGYQFKQNVMIHDSVSNIEVPIRFKTAMLNIMMKLIESGLLKFSSADIEFERQLREYRIIGGDGMNIRTSKTNEHIIDGVGLACYELYTRYLDILKVSSHVETYGVALPAPEYVPSVATIQQDDESYFKAGRSALLEQGVYASFGRGLLGRGSPSRANI